MIKDDPPYSTYHEREGKERRTGERENATYLKVLISKNPSPEPIIPRSCVYIIRSVFNSLQRVRARSVYNHKYRGT